ncbi:hypothetical protein CR513_26854, partial [Mucuna pruriens]
MLDEWKRNTSVQIYKNKGDCEYSPMNGVAERKNRHFLEIARALLFQMSIPNVCWEEVVLIVTYLINRYTRHYENSCVYTPQQNGVAEGKNHHFLEVTRVLLFQILSQMSIPNVYWEEVVLTATYLIHRLLTRVLNAYQVVYLPSRVFGCVAFVHSHNPHCGKLDPRSVKYVFIGYPSNKKWFKCYHPPSCQIFVSRDATFHEIPSTLGESYLEVKPVIESLPFPIEDVQVQEVTPRELITKKIHNEVGEEDQYYGKQ